MSTQENFLSLFRTVRFLPLFICQFLAAFSDNLIRTAMAALVTYEASIVSGPMKPVIVTMAMALFMLPFILLSATGGQLADKFNKAKLIRIIKFSSIFITSIGVWGFHTENYFLVLVSIFLTGIDSSLFGPAKYSILPDHLQKKELLMGNGLIEAGTFIAILIGIILGGLASSPETGGLATTSFILIAISIAGFVATLFIPDTEPAAPKLEISANLFAETANCLSEARSDRDTWLSILGISWFWLLGGVFMAQMPTFTRESLNGDNSVFILLLSLFSIGTGVGSLICNRLLKGQIDTQYVPISMFAMTAFTFLLWYSSTYFVVNEKLRGIHYFLSSIKGQVAALSTFMIAVFGGIYIVPLYAFLQVRAKKAFRSRVIAANNIMNAIYIVVASVIAMGVLAIGVGVSHIILILALANFVTSFYICRILPDTIIKNLFQTLFRLFYKIEINGIENFYKAGKRALIIANHASFIDPPLLGAFLPKRLVFAIDTYQAQSLWIKPFLSYLRAYPIDPSNAMATKTLIEQLKKDRYVVIFPEGRITVTGSMMKIYEGPGLIADKADAALLPVRIDGPQYSPFSRLHGKVRIKMFPKITITIMAPQKIKVDDKLVGRERRRIIGKKLYDIMSHTMFAGAKYNQTLFESIIEASEQFGKKHVIIEDADHNKLTYKRIILGSFLLGQKMAKQTTLGEYVGILLPSTAGTVVTFFATQVFGRIPAMLNFSTGVKNIISSCEAAKIQKIYTSRRFIDKANLHNLIDSLQQAGLKIIMLEDLRKSISIIDKIRALSGSLMPKEYYRKINRNNPIKATDPAVVLFTSGSEGTPKGVVLSHSNIQSNVKQAASRVDFSSSDIIFNALPMFHSFGLTGGLLLPIISGVKIFLYPSPLHYRIIPEMVYSSNATIMFGTDTFLAGYAKFAHPYDFFSIRYIFAGAEKLRDETRKTYMNKFGIRIFEGYGATEAAPIISVNTPMHYRAGTVGRLLPSMEYYLEPVPGIEKGGRLIIKGPNVMLGYLKSDKPGELQRPDYSIDGKVKRGWYDTGDIVDVDDDGFITILGRAKRFAKIGGEMVSLTAVEEAIYRNGGEFAHAVVSIPHPSKGEVMVLLTTDKSIDRTLLQSLIRSAGFAEIYIPRIIHHLDQMPVLATGKVDYVSLADIVKQLDFGVGDKEDEAEEQ